MLGLLIASFLPHRKDVLFRASVRNRPATEPVTLKVCNVKLSFDI